MAIDLDAKPASTPLRSVFPTRRSIGALVMDADYRGLAVVRSLGRHGIPVWVLQHGDQLLATLSRYNRRTLSWPSQDEEEKVDFLVNLADRESIRHWVLLPTGDEGAALVARHHRTLGEHFQLTTPPWDVLQWLYDKRLTYRLADRVGVDHPWTLYPANAEQVAASECPYPVILKPAYSSSFNRFTIQELIPGGGDSQFSYTALCQDGRAIASLTARRTRQIPMDFGRASTFVETVDDPAASTTAIRLIEALRYTGIAEVEFKRDRRDGKLKLLDINPRVWGWHSLCGFAGVDYPYLLWLMTIGEPVPATKAAVGVRWVRMSTDTPTAIREVLRGRLSLREYLRSIRPPVAPAIYASDDPVPGVLEIPLLAYLFGKRVLSGGRIA